MVHEVSDEDDDEAIESTPEDGIFSPPAAEDYFNSPFSPRSSLHRLHSRMSSSSSMVTLTRNRRRPLTRLHTELLLNMVLQDAQARLVFRAQALVQAEVAYYSPKPADLEWPEKLKGVTSGEPLVKREATNEDDDDPLFMHLPPDDAQETWYPTLRVTLRVLACLYSYIDVSMANPTLSHGSLSYLAADRSPRCL